MGVGGAEWLERPERETEENVEGALDAIGLKKGMVVAEVGAAGVDGARQIDGGELGAEGEGDFGEATGAAAHVEDALADEPLGRKLSMGASIGIAESVEKVMI